LGAPTTDVGGPARYLAASGAVMNSAGNLARNIRENRLGVLSAMLTRD